MHQLIHAPKGDEHAVLTMLPFYVYWAALSGFGLLMMNVQVPVDSRDAVHVCIPNARAHTHTRMHTQHTRTHARAHLRIHSHKSHTRTTHEKHTHAHT